MSSGGGSGSPAASFSANKANTAERKHCAFARTTAIELEIAMALCKREKSLTKKDCMRSC